MSTMNYNGYRPLGCECDYAETTTPGDYGRGERNYLLARVDPECPLHGITEVARLEATLEAVQARLAQLKATAGTAP